VQFSAASVIDDLGMTGAVAVAIERGITELGLEPGMVEVLLDGALKAPAEFQQKTIIHGDSLVPIISLASVAAKVSRDRVMRDLAQQYPVYGFEQHKGYATEAHYAALKVHGLSTVHRHTFVHLN
jgi:ribonuclease HII